MEQTRYGKYIVLPFSEFQKCIQNKNKSKKTRETNPILPKTMSKRSVDLVKQLQNYPDKIQFQQSH